MPKIMVTGGAGYIGSHIVKMLGDKGYDVLIYDSLVTGKKSAILAGELVVGDLADVELLRKTFERFKPVAVMHFAAFIRVDESMADPFKYYENNTVNAIKLLSAMKDAGVEKFIFSSTAATYGMPEKRLIDETTPQNPINPYGHSKLLVERILNEISELGFLKFVALRYFNVAGADPGGKLGQNYDEATHLITRALKTAKGEFKKLSIFGTDYDTPDGTCIRDYIHVTDLASAHILALEYLLAGGESDCFNLGYGKGYSVREVVAEAIKVTGIDFKVEETDRRAGDPDELVAISDKAKYVLKWQPEHNDLGRIIETAWNWEKQI